MLDDVTKAFYAWADPPNTTAEEVLNWSDMDELKLAFAAGHAAGASSRDAAVAGLVEALTFAAHEVYLDDSKLLAEIQEKAAGALRALAAARTPVPATLKEVVEKARGGPAPTPFQGFA